MDPALRPLPAKGKGVEAVTGRDGVSSTTTRAGRARTLKIVLRTAYSAAISILTFGRCEEWRGWSFVGVLHGVRSTVRITTHNTVHTL